MNDLISKKIGLTYFYPVEFECNYFEDDLSDFNSEFFEKMKKLIFIGN